MTQNEDMEHGCAYAVASDSATPWTVARQASLSLGFSKQEYQSGLPFPTPGDLPNPGIEPQCPALAGGFFTTSPPGKLLWNMNSTELSIEGF